MTMLGAIVVIFGWFLWESGLLRRRDKLAPFPSSAPVYLSSGPLQWERSFAADEAMRHAGAVDIQRRNGS
jgi:hypothetical protein